ncbi:MAG: FKBP-type peptidyl-prolyl cis-trans isomerase [Pseudomonadales bacterium]
MATVLATPSAFAATLDTQEQKVSYSFGLMVAGQIKPGFEELDLEAFTAAVKDVYENKEPQLNQTEIEAVLKAFQEKQIAAQQEELKKLSEANKAKGEAFLAENAKRDGVKTTQSGLQYEILTAGEGESPTAADTVQVHYTGTLIDGTVFDSSVQRGQPATFPLGGVIKGWTEGLQLIKKGAKAKLYIPAELAYGATGSGQAIGPNEALVFEVELLDITKAEPKAE